MGLVDWLSGIVTVGKNSKSRLTRLAKLWIYFLETIAKPIPVNFYGACYHIMQNIFLS